MKDEEDNTKKKSKRISIDEIIEQIKKENLLFHDVEDGVGYIAVGGKGDEVYRIDSGMCKKWVRNWFVKKYKRHGLNQHHLEEICGYLASVAEIDGEERRLGVRLYKELDAYGNPKAVLYDTRNGMAVKTTADGWSLVSTPPCFKHFPHQKRQALPEQTDSRNLDILREFVNIEDDDDWLVFLVFVVSAMVPDSPSVLLCMNGDMGAGKSESLRMVIKLADPSALIDGMKMTWRAEDLVRYASKNSILFDNLSKITDNQSDDLCKVCTGGALTVRRLYTTDDEEVYHICRPVLISGIPRLIHRADLNDRSIILTVKRIPESKRKTQAELDACFNDAKPKILGTIFNVLADAIRKYPIIEPKEHPRSADWYKLACSIAASLDGYSQSKFEMAFKKVKDRQLEYALDESPVAMAAKFLVDKCGGQWCGTATSLMDFDVESAEKPLSNEEVIYIQYLQEHSAWPKNASVLGKELARCRPLLDALGIDMIHGENGKSVYKDNRRYIQLTDRNRKKDNFPSTLFDTNLNDAENTNEQ